MVGFLHACVFGDLFICLADCMPQIAVVPARERYIGSPQMGWRVLHFSVSCVNTHFANVKERKKQKEFTIIKATSRFPEIQKIKCELVQNFFYIFLHFFKVKPTFLLLAFRAVLHLMLSLYIVVQQTAMLNHDTI